MLFNSWVFVLFIVLVLPAYHAVSHRWQNRLLLVSSYVFYGWWDWRFLFLLFGSTVLDYFVARRLEREEAPGRRKAFLGVSVCGNLGVLGFFKYFDFFVESAATSLQWLGLNPNLPLLHVVLPVGISFYTFQTLGYTVDVYRRNQKACQSFVDFGLYVCYFPQLVAGPIERASRLLPQIQSPRHSNPPDWNSGAQLILWGYLKKVAVADSLASYVETAFFAPGTCPPLMLLLALYAFALQIYCDFSGYTDIARGVSRLFGIQLMENFKQPYLARNITEFWRRWHISLSTWLRDYLYVPLGGNRYGRLMQYRNLFITMLLGGLWHGADWKFVVWGGLHGVYLAVHKFVSGDRRIGFEAPPSTLRDWLTFMISVVATFHLVCFAWIFFRAADLSVAMTYIRVLILQAPVGSYYTTPFEGLPSALLAYGIMVGLLDFACWRRNRDLPFLDRHRWWVRGLAYGAGVVVLAYVRSGTGAAFIYFQF